MKTIKIQDMESGKCYYWLNIDTIRKVIKLNEKRQDNFIPLLDVQKDKKHLTSGTDVVFLAEIDALYLLEDYFLFYLNQTRDKIRKLEG